MLAKMNIMIDSSFIHEILLLFYTTTKFYAFTNSTKEKRKPLDFTTNIMLFTKVPTTGLQIAIKIFVALLCSI